MNTKSLWEQLRAIREDPAFDLWLDKLDRETSEVDLRYEQWCEYQRDLAAELKESRHE